MVETLEAGEIEGFRGIEEIDAEAADALGISALLAMQRESEHHMPWKLAGTFGPIAMGRLRLRWAVFDPGRPCTSSKERCSTEIGRTPKLSPTLQRTRFMRKMPRIVATRFHQQLSS